MATNKPDDLNKPKRIIVNRNGPYVVEGEIPLVHKTQIVSEYGEPLSWRYEGIVPTSAGKYRLCRCGQSSQFPFCDDTHEVVGFDGTESADSGASAERALPFPRGTHILVKKDSTLCMDSGYCGLRDVGIAQLVTATNDTKIRSLVIAMVERCPSGALTYRIDEDGQDIEPDLPLQIAVTTEITSDGPIAGPLWVTGGIPIERSDGQPFETRNRVTLCNCGHSSCMPLCDGTHRLLAEREARRRRAFRREGS
jgi:CDGSH-type Zn-finger protein